MGRPYILPAQAELLQATVTRRGPEGLALVDSALAGRKLTVEEANLIRDALGDELADSGVDPTTGAINERGRRLDALIDVVAAMSELHDD